MRAGKLRDLVTFERATVTADGYGGEVSTWAKICQRGAEVNYGRGDERRSAAQENATLAATFRVRADQDTDAITTKDRIQFEGAAWDITSNVRLLREGRDITAIRQT